MPHIHSFHALIELRGGVRAVVTQWGARDWQRCGEARALPNAFVKAFAGVGGLSALGREAYQGANQSLKQARAVTGEINRTGANSDAVWQAVNVSLQAYGAFGLVTKYDIERKFCLTWRYLALPAATRRYPPLTGGAEFVQTDPFRPGRACAGHTAHGLNCN